MNAAVWTLWLVTFAPGTGSATPAIQPLATYESEASCESALGEMWNELKRLYGKDANGPGLMFCLRGIPPKR